MLLARWINKADAWARVSEPSAWERDNFPFECLSELVPDSEGGLSFYAVASLDDPLLQRIAVDRAICTASKENFNKTVFAFADLEKVEGLGLEVRRTAGKCLDAEVSAAHRDVFNITGPIAVRLMKLMPDLIEFRSEELAKLVAKSLANGYIDLMHQGIKQRQRTEIIAALVAKKLFDPARLVPTL